MSGTVYGNDEDQSGARDSKAGHRKETEFYFSVIIGSFMDLFSLNQPSKSALFPVYDSVSAPLALRTPSSYTRPLQHSVADLFNGPIPIIAWIQNQ